MYSFHFFSPASLQDVGVRETIQHSTRTNKSDFHNSLNLVFNQEEKKYIAVAKISFRLGLVTDFLDVAVVYLVG